MEEEHHSFCSRDFIIKKEERYYLLVYETFQREDFSILLNKVYEERNIILVGFSSFNPYSLVYDQLTSSAGRYDTFFLAPHSYQDIYNLLLDIDYGYLFI